MRKWFWLSTGILVLIVLVWLFSPEDNTDWHPYKFEDEIDAIEARYMIPDEENAAFAYYDIFDNLVLDSNEPEFFLNPTLSQESSLDKPWKSDDHPEMVEWLKNYDQTIERLITVSKIEKCILPPKPFSERYELLDMLPKYRHCIYLLISSANNGLAEDRFEEAFEKYISTFKMAEQLRQVPSHTSVLVHCAVKQIVLLPLNHYIIEGQPDSQQLQMIATIAGDMQNNWSSDWPDMLELDKLACKNKITAIAYERNSNGQSRFSRLPFMLYEQSPEDNERINTYQSGAAGKAKAILRWLCFPSSPETIGNLVDETFADYFKMGEPDYDWDKVSKRYNRLRLNYRDAIKLYLSENGYGYPEVHNIYLQYVTEIRGSRLLVAIRQYYNENNKWPDSLDDIESTVPAEALEDPAGGTFNYEKNSDGFSLSGKLIDIWPRSD